MTLAGARGETESEMREALQFQLEEPELHEAFNALDSALVSAGSGAKKRPGEEKPDTLQTANGLWAQRGYAMREPFLTTLAEHYGAGVRPVDFESASEEARSQINEWAADRTNDKIKNLLPSGAVHSRTRLILTAAIYFRAGWDSTFDEEDTKEEEFQNLSGDAATVEMMHQKLRKGYRFASGSDYRAVELPYGSGAFSMVVVVPDEGSFSDVESNLDAEFAQSLFESLERKAVDLALPKFELSGRFSAASALGELGMEKPFQQEADFSRMSEQTDLMINDVVHEAYVSVDEEGTEAAAASAPVMIGTSMPAGEPDYEEVTVDRPFLFMLRHTETDSVLFFGRVVDL
jgi:serpin B